MKKFYLMILIFLLISRFNAQEIKSVKSFDKKVVDTENTNLLKGMLTNSSQLDSVYENVDQPDGFPGFKVKKYYYYSGDNCTSIKHITKMGSMDWYNNRLESFSYDISGNVTEYVEQWDNDGSGLVNFEQGHFEYDVNNNLVLFYKRYWSSSINDWSTSYDIYERVYNEENVMIENHKIHMTASGPDSHYRKDYIYNTDNTLDNVFAYIESNGSWDLISKNEYLYSNGKLIEIKNYNYDNGDWLLTQKNQQYNYDEEDNMIADIRTTESGSQTDYLYTYDYSYMESKSTYYNTILSHITHYDYNLDYLMTDLKQLADISVLDENYNDFDKPRFVFYRNIPTSSYNECYDTQDCDRDVEYFYTLTPLSLDENTQKTSIYPNPASKFLKIHSNQFNSNETIVTILNPSGMILKQSKLIDDIIDVTRIDEGVYILILESYNSKFSTKFIKF